MNPLYIIIIVLALLYVAYIIYEKIYYTKIRKSFKYVIHVNGIRGKSTTTRLIDAGLRQCGFKVFSKTTGTIPTMINTNNEDKVVFRMGNANIREQLKMMKRAYKEKADILVIECMAVNPNLQEICEHLMLKADICVITNVRMDHIKDMGEDLFDIAKAFCRTIPTNGNLVLNHSSFDSIFENASKSLGTTINYTSEYNGDNLETFSDNIALALEVANVLGLDKDKYFEGMKKYHHDYGAFKRYKINDMIFLNGLSINDPTSIKIVYDQIIKEYDYKDISILLNSRSDRPARVLQHIEMIKEMPCKKVIIYGSNIEYIYKQIRKKYDNILIEKLNYKNIKELEKEKIVFAVGNIGGRGHILLKYFQKNGEMI